MGHEVTNVQQVLAYGSEKLTRKLLLLALVLFACGLADVVWFDDPRFPGWPVMAAGLGWTLWEFWRLHNPGKPLVMLSPDGVSLRIVGVKDVLIPWADVRAVGCEGDTIVEVSKRFYERFIYVGNFFMRGPGWDNTFIRNGDTVQIVFHREALPVEPEVLRAEMEARWNAFKGKRTAAARSSGSTLVPLIVSVLSALALVYLFAARSGLIENWQHQRRERQFAEAMAEHERARKQVEAEFAKLRREMDEKSKKLFAPFDDRKSYAERQEQERDAANPPQPLGPSTGHRGAVVAIAASPDGKSLISAGLDRTVKLWDMRDPKTVRNIGSHKDTVRAVAVLPDGAHALTAGDDGEIVLRRLADGGIAHVFDMHEYGGVEALALSPDGRRAASAHRAGKVVIWDVEARAQLHLLDIGSRPTAVAFSSDGARLVGASYEGTLRIWETASGTPVRTFGGKDVIYTVAFLPGGLRVVSGGQDDPLRIWDVESGQVVRTFFDKPANGMQFTTIISVAVSADGKRILSGDNGGTAQLWDIETGKQVASFNNGVRINVVAFAPDGSILTGGGNQIRLWRPNGQAVRVFAGAG